MTRVRYEEMMGCLVRVIEIMKKEMDVLYVTDGYKIKQATKESDTIWMKKAA
jgi:hypothetical protein